MYLGLYKQKNRHMTAPFEKCKEMLTFHKNHMPSDNSSSSWLWATDLCFSSSASNLNTSLQSKRLQFLQNYWFLHRFTTHSLKVLLSHRISGSHNADIPELSRQPVPEYSPAIAHDSDLWCPETEKALELGISNYSTTKSYR